MLDVVLQLRGGTAPAAIAVHDYAAAAACAYARLDAGRTAAASWHTSTVGRAAHLVLHDTSVTKEQRRERARGMLKLGRIFQGQFTPQ